MLAAIILWPLPPNASAHGPALDQHLILNLWIFAALFVLAHLILLAGLILRRREHKLTRNATLARALVEYLPLAALALLFTFLTLRAERLWAATRYTGPNPSALQVEAVGVQFAWYFRYPGPDAAFGRTSPRLISPATANPLGLDPADTTGIDDLITSELVLPANHEVDLHLRAQDVIHGFSVPALRIKQNAVPGQTFHIHFTPTIPGTYAILCTQLCGLGHYRMTANLRIVTPQEYTRWLASKTDTP